MMNLYQVINKKEVSARKTMNSLIRPIYKNEKRVAHYRAHLSIA